MTGETKNEIRNSLLAYTELRLREDRLSFADNTVPSIRVDLRVEEPHHLVYLARLIAALGYEEIHFQGAYLWITNWGVWNPLEEAIAFKTLEQFRRSLGENRSTESAPGHSFRHNEFVESVCCLLQPMVIGCDAYYVPTWAYGAIDYFIFVSHDSIIDIHVRTQEMKDKVMKILAAGDWIAKLTKY